MQIEKVTVCMLSCRHSLLDDRIYKKEALTLAQNGYNVIHIGYGDENQDYYTNDGIRLIQVKRLKKGSTIKSKFNAFRQSYLDDLFKVAESVSAAIYHLHDVELCRIALKLKKLPWKPKIIYDAHEPFYENLLDYWVNRSLPQVFFVDIPALFAEKKILKKADFLIATEKNVASRFRKKNSNTEIIYNYSFFQPDKYVDGKERKEYDAIYCGSITESKGILNILNSIALAKRKGYDFKVVLVGDYNINPLTKQKIDDIIERENIGENIVFTGNLPIEDVAEYYKKSKVGLCIFPKNRVTPLILPIKLFEYPSFGLPMIGSDFGHIKEIIRSNNIGLTVNPFDIHEIVAALIDLVINDNYKNYFSTCINCVNEKYLWDTQKPVLLSIYKNLML